MKNPQQLVFPFTWPTQRANKAEIICRSFWLYFAAMLFFILMAVMYSNAARKSWLGITLLFAFGWWSSKNFPSLWKKFLIFLLLHFPKLKKFWRNYVRPKETSIRNWILTKR
jgi:hypothetical protein